MRVERLKERRYRIMLRLPLLWRWAYRHGTWEEIERWEQNEDGAWEQVQ